MAVKNKGIIIRQNLKRIYEEISDARIIYVCAPAGYGKTVAVRQWFEQNGYESAFVSLDEFDNDSAHFCRRFCAALCECQPKNAALHKITAHPSFDSTPEEFALRTLTALSGDKHIHLVIDDLHFVDNERVLRLLLGFLKRLPENFQIVLISRNELPPEFAYLWLKGHLARITADDLRFSRDEIILLYKESKHFITPKKADEILSFTDGWAIGIGALLLSGNATGSPEGASIEYLEEFIKTHIWLRWDEETREFLLKTSVVKELTPTLCAALTDIVDSEKLLDKLVKQNAFISRTGNGVYRYHNLFHNCLLHMLEERGGEYVRALQSRVGYWYLGERDFYSAIEFFIKCENCEGIVKCLEFLSGSSREFAFVEKLISVAGSPLIREAAEKYPYIYALLVWMSFNNGRASDMAYYADQYYKNQTKIIRKDTRFASASILILLIDFRNSLKDLKKSVLKIFMLAIKMKLSDVEADLGIINQNMPLMHRGTRDCSESVLGNAETNIAVLKKMLGGLLGGYGVMLMECLIAGLLCEQAQLERALGHALTANAKIEPHFSAESKFIAMATHIYILDALEQNEQADKIIQKIDGMIEEENAYYLSCNFNALKIRRKLIKGDMKAADDWLDEYGKSLHDILDFYKLYGHITTCRAYITKGDYDSAIILSKKILTLAESYNRPLDIIEAQILLSISYWKKKRGFQNEAMSYLEQAVSLAYKYEFIQLFINEGVELSGMMRRLQKSVEQRKTDAAVSSDFIKMLYLKTLEYQKDGLTSGQPVTTEKYTDKQLTVMRLLCDGKSYRGIAEIMGIKLPTLRSHIALIYKKLDVTSETDAVIKIKTLGILGDE